MQFNIFFKTIFEYIHKKFRFVHTNTFCKCRKKLRASPRVHLVIIYLYAESWLHTVIFYEKSIIVILNNRNGNASDKNNYQPIVIVIAMSKLFKLCLSNILDEYLCTSENQFDFKKKHAIDFCIYTVKYVIKYYKYFSSTVFTGFLDASKAFDRVTIIGFYSRSYY